MLARKAEGEGLYESLTTWLKADNRLLLSFQALTVDFN